MVIAWIHRVGTVDVPESTHCQRTRGPWQSSSVTPWIVMKNDGVLYHQVSSFSPESMRLRSLRESEITTARDPVQQKRWTHPYYRAVKTEHQQRWTLWWCTTPSKHVPKGDSTWLKILENHWLSLLAISDQYLHYIPVLYTCKIERRHDSILFIC